MLLLILLKITYRVARMFVGFIRLWTQRGWIAFSICSAAHTAA